MTRKQLRRAIAFFALITVAPLFTACEFDMSGIGDALVEACEQARQQPRMSSTIC